MTPIHHITYLQAIVVGLIQGLTELFPISSLGHTVLIPAWIGGTWGALVSQESRPESSYLAFIVGLHLATAVVLVAWYWRTWVRLIGGLVTSIARRRVDTPDQRLAWLLILATIPVGVVGLLLEHPFRVLFAKPLAAAIFLTANGGILFLGERYRRRPQTAGPADLPSAGPVSDLAGPAGRASGDPAAGPASPGQERDDGAAADCRLAQLGAGSAFWIGAAQILALLAGISREGVTMVGGLWRGLNHEDAMRFAFLLSTPVILAAGALKIPDLTGSLGAGIHGQVLAGSVAAAATSLFAVVFLARYFRTRTLLPFAVYCVLAGLASIVRFAVW
jgi:undecaprenyl-diphosphatase